MLREDSFAQRKINSKFNSSYPINPIQWEPFRTNQSLDYSCCKELSFYIHIPFCQHLCQFCEYQRTTIPTLDVQYKYLNAIKCDVELFLSKYHEFTLKGFDIGGGTPTALDDDAFNYLLNIYSDILKNVTISDDFEPSIEATFQTLNMKKINMIAASGINRISLGIQTSVKSIQKLNGRVNPEILNMLDLITKIKESGIKKVNLDLMYGLKGQTIYDINDDIECIRTLNPEQVTLYELRTNMIDSSAYKSTKEQLYNMYCKLFKELRKLGYYSKFGQNTFSKSRNDFGLSSYLKNRMIEFIPYKGFGLSAQSMATNGISYNIGKLDKNIKPLIEHNCNYPEQDIYKLTRKELLSKFIAISAYYGRFSIHTANQILGEDFTKLFKAEINYCIQQGYIKMNYTNIMLTQKGFKYYGAVFSLFYKQSPKIQFGH